MRRGINDIHTKKSSIKKIKSGKYLNFYFSIPSVEHHIGTYVRKASFHRGSQCNHVSFLHRSLYLLKAQPPQVFIALKFFPFSLMVSTIK